MKHPMFKTLPDKVAKGQKTATFLAHVGLPEKTKPTHYVAQHHYKCEQGDEVWYVVVSAADVPYSGPETYIFPSNEKGTILKYTELPGSFRGALDHARALRNAGYVVIGAPINKQALREAIEAAELQVEALVGM